jgi:hypothetical protein
MGRGVGVWIAGIAGTEFGLMETAGRWQGVGIGMEAETTAGEGVE